MDHAPFEPHRFKSTVAYYQKYRLGYPPRLIARLVALLGLAPGDSVLDLGSGPGTLSVPLAQAGLAVTAMDPEPDMLAAAEVAAAAAGVGLTAHQGSSFDLTPAMGPFRLVTIGRAFHWMDRAATLAMLGQIVAPGGGIAFFHDAHPPVPENDWFKVLREVGDKYGRAAAFGGAPAAERRGGHRRYEPFLFASAFTVLDGLSVTIRKALSADDVVGRAFSMSICSHERLGETAGAFEDELRARLARLSPEGNFVEVAELVALLARRAP